MKQLTVDLYVAAGSAALYLILALALIPAPTSWKSALLGMIVFGAVAALALFLGRGAIPGLSLWAIAVISGAVLVMPTLPAIGGTSLVAIPIGFLGMQAAMLLWAALRWEPRDARRRRVSLREAWLYGLYGATGLSVIATFGVLLAFTTNRGPGLRILLVYPMYYIGMLAAATCYWVLQGVSHLATGRYLTGVVGGTCVYFAAAPVVALLEGEPMSVVKMAAIAAIAGGIVGPAVALSFTDADAAA